MKKLLIVLVLSIYLLPHGIAQFKVLHFFNDTAGSEPPGTLTLLGHKLYGMTRGGGTNNDGTIFSIDTNGSNYKVLFNFNMSNGAYPTWSHLTLCGNKFFGVTYSGGTYSSGVLFSLDTNGTNYKVLVNFDGINGSEPQAALVASGNKLFGTTEFSGGTIFCVDTDGTKFKTIYSFYSAKGESPWGSVTISGNKLYGMTNWGGAYNVGVVFSIDTSGNNYDTLFSFNDSNGARPYGTLLLLGRKLYGMTSAGGRTGYGVLFSVDTNGTNDTNLIEFNTLNGGVPYGSLIFDSGKLYGTVSESGPKGDGVVFSLDTNGNKYKCLYSFKGSDGNAPQGDLVYSAGALYGLTVVGGTGSNGVIFKIDTNAPSSVGELLFTNGLIKLFPNPNHGVFTIQETESRIQNSVVEIYNMLGEKIYSQTLNIEHSTFNINMGNPAGIYMYRIISADGKQTATGKFIVE